MHELQAVVTSRRRPPAGDRIARFVVPDMRTRQCTGRITDRIGRLDGVSSVRTDIRSHRVTVRFQPLLTGLAEMTAAIQGAGCSVADMVQSGAGRLARDIQFTVPAMDCEHCADHLSRALKRLPGVIVVATDVADRRVTVRFAPEKVEAAMITAAVARAGYRSADG